MFRTNDIKTKLSVYKNFVTDQTFNGFTVRNNTAAVAFSGSSGLGAADGNSSVVFATIGGFNDQRAVATLKYVSPTVSPNEEIGVILRLQTFDSPNATYYYARVDGGLAKISKVVNGTFTTLTQSAFSLSQGSYVTITFQVVGSQLTATFDASGSPTTVNLSATDTAITTGGLGGFRSLSSSIFCTYFSMEEL